MVQKRKIKLEDIFCHVGAGFLIKAVNVGPAILEKNIPETMFLLQECQKCGQKYCIIIRNDGSFAIEFRKIETEEEMGKIMAEAYKDI